jgi:uncharacterized cupin superfamily protein
MIIDLNQVPEQTTSNYPLPFQAAVAGRIKQRLGDRAGLTHFGVNLTRLAPGSCSALHHWHSQQDEFIYVLQGQVILVTDTGEQQLDPGMAAAFPAGVAEGHHLVNRSESEVLYLEIGDRSPDDQVYYPNDDLVATDTGQGWRFTHKNGEVYHQ